MKAVLMSIKPYWGFLIIAEEKGWDLKKYGLHKKTVEVRKGKPKDDDWDKKVNLYFTKDQKSLARIPEEYRKEVEALCGKVVCKFESNKQVYIGNVTDWEWNRLFGNVHEYHKYLVGYCGCLTETEVHKYFNGKVGGYALEIENLKVYDTPKDLGEFRLPCDKFLDCLKCHRGRVGDRSCQGQIERAPESWCYVEDNQ